MNNKELLDEIKKLSKKKQANKTDDNIFVSVSFLLIAVTFLVISLAIKIFFPNFANEPYAIKIFDFIVLVTVIGLIFSQLFFYASQMFTKSK